MSTEHKPRAAVIGRRIGAGTFWLMAAFVMLASTRSVVIELYGTPATRHATHNDVACADGLRSLSRSLLDHAGDELRLPRDRSRMVRWLADWDKRYATLEEPCGALQEPRRAVFDLRENIEAMLHRHEREQLPLTERIERALLRLSSGPHA